MSASKEAFMELRQEQLAASQGISFEHLIDAKKDNLRNAINLIGSEIRSGNYDSLKGLILAVKGKSFFTDLEKELRPLAENDYLDKLGKDYAIHDTKIEQAATKTDWDYSVCGDPVYHRLMQKLENADKDFKDRQTFLKAITKATDLIDDETGEVFRCLPPNKIQKEGLRLTIK